MSKGAQRWRETHPEEVKQNMKKVNLAKEKWQFLLLRVKLVVIITYLRAIFQNVYQESAKVPENIQ